MDRNKHTPGQQGQQHTSQQNPANKNQQSSRNDQNSNANTQSHPTRDQAEGSRDKARSNMGTQERGSGSHGEKNRSGISNRGMSPDEEQLDLPSRGSTSDDASKGQSER